MTDSFTNTATSHPLVPCQVLRVAVRLLTISGMNVDQTQRKF